MNANAQQYNETLRTWNQQWTDAALGAVKAHEQFITSMVSAFNTPVAMGILQPQAREATEKGIDFATRQTLEGEKFVTSMVRDGIERARAFFNAPPDMNAPIDARKARQSADALLQESVRTAADVINRETAFVNERLNDAADLGRSMMNCGCVAMDNVVNEAADTRKRAAAKA